VEVASYTLNGGGSVEEAQAAGQDWLEAAWLTPLLYYDPLQSQWICSLSIIMSL
jgi:hypothetical protein